MRPSPSSRPAPTASPSFADAHIAPIAALLANPARATMLLAISDGRILSAGELARAARISASTASAHLAKLVSAGILSAHPEGRHRCYRIANPAIVAAIEALALVAAPMPARSLNEASAARAVRLARTCYDHLAGALGVAVTEALVREGVMSLHGREFTLSPGGTTHFAELGLDVAAVAAAARQTRRPFARACQDWSERRYHLAGALGAALATRVLSLGWVERTPASRALRITNQGRRALRRHFQFQIG